MSIPTRGTYAYDSVRVGPLTTLAAVARASGASVKELKELNPQILRGMAPPRDSAMLRIPVGTATRFDSAFAGIPDSLRLGAKVVRTKGTETAEKLAAMTKVQPRRIAEFNQQIG